AHFVRSVPAAGSNISGICTPSFFSRFSIMTSMFPFAVPGRELTQHITIRRPSNQQITDILLFLLYCIVFFSAKQAILMLNDEQSSFDLRRPFMLYRYSKVLNLPVICADNGSRAGTVKEILFGTGDRQVKALLLEQKGLSAD